MVDNLIPYIGGEEEKSEKEPLKVWGKVENGVIVTADSPAITSQCLAGWPVSNGHTAAVFVDFEHKPTRGRDQGPVGSATRAAPRSWTCPPPPSSSSHYFEEPDRPQARLDRELEGGMAISVGRLRPDTQYDYKFVCLSHNTLRGAAGGGACCWPSCCAPRAISSPAPDPSSILT